jgi:phosphatidylinositol-3-phosphatase
VVKLLAWCAALVGATIALAGCGAPSIASKPPPRHVFVIVMENKSPDEALSGSFTASLASRYGVAADYRAVAHPSLPNYLALTSGQTWGVSDDNYRVLPQGGIGRQLTAAGVSWRAYMEGMNSGDCLQNQGQYDVHHNPFAFYGGRCPGNVVPLTALQGDLAGATPMFSWISPDMCHDEHNCDVSTGDAWLSSTVAAITSSPAWSADGVLFVTWDEDDSSSDNQVLTLVITPKGGHKVSRQPYDHYSLLATIEDVLGVGRLGSAAGAHPMTDLVAGG